MGLFSGLFGDGGRARTETARTLVEIAHVQAITMFAPLSKQFSALHDIDLEQWDFFVTIGGVFLATSRLEKMKMTAARKQPILDTIESGLLRFKPRAVAAFEDCKLLFEREFDRLTAQGHDPRFIGSDAFGLWIVWNVLRHQPENAEEANLTRTVGAMVIHSLFDFWG